MLHTYFPAHDRSHMWPCVPNPLLHPLVKQSLLLHPLTEWHLQSAKKIMCSSHPMIYIHPAQKCYIHMYIYIYILHWYIWRLCKVLSWF